MLSIIINLDSEIVIQRIYALIEITEQIRNACDKNLFSCGVYLDLQQVPDMVNHEILLTKLKHYGIRGTSYKWFQLFLCQRLQYTLSICHSKKNAEAIKFLRNLQKCLQE